MPDLAHSLPSKDLGFLRIVASLWGVELASTDPAAAAAELANALNDSGLIEEVTSTLPEAGRTALGTLTSAGGRMSWVNFARRFGEVREMGAGRRDREQPHLHPASAAEMLWYRALMARSFFDTDKGPQEFAYVPDDLLLALEFAGWGGERPSETGENTSSESSPSEAGDLLGRPASPAEKAHPSPADDGILDEACTLLAALRLGIDPPPTRIPAGVLSDLLISAGILASDGALQPEPARNFLEAAREKALETLREAWRESVSFNELRQLPGLAFEGEWSNEPLGARAFLLDLLKPIPKNQWWSLPAFVHDLKAKHADFQRPAGDYDSWFIKRSADGTYLRGFESWDEVDGAWARYLVTGPLTWLGLMELASPEEHGSPAAFRRTNFKPGEEKGRVSAGSNGRITVERHAPRAARYQIARFCEWEAEKGSEYRYRVTVASLEKARAQGLKPEQLLGILRKHTAAPLPPAFVRALQRWEANGTEAKVESLVVLKVSRPEVLKELKESKAARFLGDPLGPVTVAIKPGGQSRVLSALAELGLLAEIEPEKTEET